MGAGRTQSLVEFKDVNTASTALVLSHNSLLGRNRIRVAFSKNRFPPQQPPQPPQVSLPAPQLQAARARHLND